MLRVVVRRLVQLVPILLGVSILGFAWVRALPGGPAVALLGPDQQGNAAAAGAEIDRLYGLDRPLHAQYLTYLSRLAHLDLGQSVTTRQPLVQTWHCSQRNDDRPLTFTFTTVLRQRRQA